MTYFLIVLLILFLGVLVWFFQIKDLPPGTDAIVREVVKQGATGKHQGRTGHAETNGIRLWYEELGDKNGEPILLIMGHSCSALVWEPNFWQALVDAGYRVIRFDNRGVGLSDWVKDWSRSQAYNLEDMASDAIGLLDSLGIARAHLVGASMGGMIAQSIALDHPQRVISLTSMMTTGWFHNPKISGIPIHFRLQFARVFIKFFSLKNERRHLKFRIAVREIMQGKELNDYNVKEAAENALFELRERQGMNPATGWQHSRAIKLSGSRLEGLKSLRLPWLIIHGGDDPLILLQHAELSAQNNSNASTLFIDGMGHAIPDAACEIMHPVLLKHFVSASQDSFL